MKRLYSLIDLFTQRFNRRNNDFVLEYICLTDDPKVDFPNIRVIKLEHTWTGFWSKIELFRPDVVSVGQSALYFDLDTEIVGDITPVIDYVHSLQPRTLLALRDAYRPLGLQSSILGWKGGAGFDRLYEKFVESPELYIGRFYSDQEYIQNQLRHKRFEFKQWQTVFEEKFFASYKVDVIPNNGFLPRNTRVVFYHGHPRPWEVMPLWSALPWHC